MFRRLGVGCRAATSLTNEPSHPRAGIAWCCVERQAAAASFKSIVEAVLSWQTLHNEALAADILQILNLHKVSPKSGSTASRTHQLNPDTTACG